MLIACAVILICPANSFLAVKPKSAPVEEFKAAVADFDHYLVGELTETERSIAKIQTVATRLRAEGKTEDARACEILVEQFRQAQLQINRIRKLSAEINVTPQGGPKPRQ